MSQQLTLARALRYKKRVVAKIAALEADIQTNNTLIEGAEQEVDIRQALKDRDALVSHLTELKLAMTKATFSIFPHILEVAELKSKIAFLGRIPTTHGVHRDRYGETNATYRAELRKKEVTNTVTQLQSQIDDLQAKIDAYNNKTTITLEDVSVAV